ncbi:MAG: PD-(D/E)XK nuclease family protein, partial [Pseudomonadota bacterium]|nr:PD-(D/E)XK nuclease family protein [Pseudomonadota bacterium]
PAPRPAPVPPIDRRPAQIAVTDVDRLKADPYAFYAKRILRLSPLDPVDADPSAAWRGTAVHTILEQWAKDDACDPAALPARAAAMLTDGRTHPLMRALWQPRLMEAIGWIADEMTAQGATGRRVLDVERDGRIAIAGVTLKGKFDRIDRLPDGALAVVDYKTGKPPSIAAVREGFSLQLGLLGLIAQRGGFAGIAGEARGFEYWSLSKRRGAAGGFGYIESPVDPQRRDPIAPDDFVALAVAHFEDAAARWLTGDEAFTAKLKPDYAPYGEYDQLMRLDEWYGRD